MYKKCWWITILLICLGCHWSWIGFQEKNCKTSKKERKQKEKNGETQTKDNYNPDKKRFRFGRVLLILNVLLCIIKYLIIEFVIFLTCNLELN